MAAWNDTPGWPRQVRGTALGGGRSPKLAPGGEAFQITMIGGSACCRLSKRRKINGINRIGVAAFEDARQYQ